jgi:hypothetical protein
MPAEDFRRWNDENDRWTGPWELATREAWLAAEDRLLNPNGRPLPEVVANAVLRGDHAQLGVLADWLAEQGQLEPVIRDRVQGFRVLFEQPFYYGPEGPNGRQEGVAYRDRHLPFAPFVGMFMDFHDDHYPQVASVFWHVSTRMFSCVLEHDPTIGWETPEQAVAFYGNGWRLDFGLPGG